MTKAEYAEYLKSPHWVETRRGALERACHRCQLCNTKSRLHVHHRTYERLGHEDATDLTVLCRGCHEKHHDIAPVLTPSKPKKAAQPKQPSAKTQARNEARERVVVAVIAAGRPLTIPQIAELSGLPRNRVAGLVGALVGAQRLKRKGKRVAAIGVDLPKRRPQRRQTGLSETQRRRMDVRKAPCPYCGANADKRCHDRNGVESEGNHPARVEAAQRARDEQGAALV